MGIEEIARHWQGDDNVFVAVRKIEQVDKVLQEFKEYKIMVMICC